MEISPRCLNISFVLSLILSEFALISLAVDRFESRPDTSRSLLQAKTICTEDFPSKNYKILNSRCQGPYYPAKACCSALKDFACPFADAINDETTDCASRMLFYIDLFGIYPPGLFANVCMDGKKGIDCTNVTTTSSSHASIPSVSTYALLLNLFLFCLF